MNLAELAEENMKTRFKDNPCRGIVLGITEENKYVHLAWIMGRSPNSQNRVYEVDGDILYTTAADPSKVEDPRLIMYNVMRSLRKDVHVVGNGDHTDTIIDALETRRSSSDVFYDALKQRTCEPDAPTFTARIIGYQQKNSTKTYLAVLKAEPEAREVWKRALEKSGLKKDDFRKPGIRESELTEKFNAEIGQLCGLDHHDFPTIRSFHELPLLKGFGYCVTTYKSGSRELPPFEGEPFIVPLKATYKESMLSVWNALEPEWKVSIGGKQISMDGEYEFAKPINRFRKVEQ